MGNSKYNELTKINILNVEIHNVTMTDTLSILKEMAFSGKAHHVMTVNPEFIMIAQSNKQFNTVLANAALKIADGIGVVLASHILGHPLKERVAGVDMVMHMARIAQENNLRIFLLGAAPGVAERTAEILEEKNPGLKIAGTYAGSPRPEEEETICAIIEKVKPHILLVAYGPPKQDLWIARTMNRLQIPIAVGVGGSFDFIAGVAKRAPKWMQQLGLEWLHRLIREPWRWRRMLTLPQFAYNVFRVKLKSIALGARANVG